MAKRTEKASSIEAPVQLGPKGSNRSLPQSLTSAELTALEVFCTGVKGYETTIDEWKSANEGLDLTVHAYIPQCSAEVEETVQVKFTRTITTTEKNGTQSRVRVKINHSIKLTKEVCDQDVAVVSGAGDQLDQLTGDLRIILKFRRNS